MALDRAIFLFIGILYLSDEITSQSDLQSALAEIDRRQNELAEYEEQQRYDVSPYDHEDQLAFLNTAGERRGYDNDYLDDENYDPISKRLTTSFRERLEQDKEKQLEEFARNLYNNLESNGMPGGLDTNYLRELWDRYYGNDVNYANAELRKRYYPVFELEDNNNKKLGNYFNIPEPMYSIHHHVPRDDVKRRRYLRGNALKQDNSYENSKRFVVSKRSSTYNKDQKRSVKKQTDPKVEKDLSNIFGNEPKTTVETNKLVRNVATSAQNPEQTRKIEKKDKPKIDSNKDDDLNKEVFAPVAPQIKKPLRLKKKSIDWSDYFGLDRRKKSDPNNGLDKEWLMERYHKAIALSAKKRNADLPLQSLRNQEALNLNNEEKITDMNQKLGKLEDEIVEDTLKYTGAHQDDSDSKETQDVKDNIISRLAQAYNIEKMRNAIEEYKVAIEKARKEFEKSQLIDKVFPDYTVEDKRVSVPRKEAVDDNKDTMKADNNIKCTTSDDCHEQNYQIPSDVLEIHFTTSECPAVQRACNDVASITGHYGHVFEAACNIHQMCLLCSNNSWFPPTRQCNMLFIAKAIELCLGKEECKKEARRSVRYLLDINKSLEAQTALTDECELQCPDNNILSK